MTEDSQCRLQIKTDKQVMHEISPVRVCHHYSNLHIELFSKRARGVAKNMGVASPSAHITHTMIILFWRRKKHRQDVLHKPVKNVNHLKKLKCIENMKNSLQGHKDNSFYLQSISRVLVLPLSLTFILVLSCRN